MLLKNFRVNVIIRIIFLFFTLFVLAYIIRKPNLEISNVLLIFLILFQVFNLIKYVEKTNKKLTQLLQSIRYSDFGCSFSDKGLGKNFRLLNNELNNVVEAFKKNRAAKEEQYHYLQTIVQHVPIGIIVYNRQGKIDIFNNEAKKLLKFANILNIQDLSGIKSDLPQLLLNMKTGDKTLVKMFIENQILQLSIYATEFRMKGDDYTLISLQDIHLELEKNEIESWQKLIRVLIHEVMNSITPISSLSSTVNELLIDEKTNKIKSQNIDKETAESVQNALNVIERRSKGLKKFVEVYRNYTNIPKPNFQCFSVAELLDKALQLLMPKLEKLNISYSTKIFPHDLMLTADPDLIDQVIINLILNAIDAIKSISEPNISIVAFKNSKNRIVINVTDNGYGIKPDILDKIFIPFFTSKRKGSGIGLSLSRQIMHLHKGNISVKSIPDEGSIFTLTF